MTVSTAGGVASGSETALGPSAPTVLLVDEEALLAELHLGLRRRGRNYRLLFASSAQEAMTLLDAEAVDMVVSGLRMPERSGADLLEEARFRFPDVIRYLLSGHADDRLVSRSVAVTHRWLAKPCDTDVLIGALDEATGRRATILDPQVRRAIGAVDALPTHPPIHAALMREFAGQDTSAARVAALAATDPAFAVKLLQWANSADAGRDPIYDVGRAVERIGLEALGPLSRADDLLRPFASSEVIPGYGVDLFNRHARMVGAVAAGLTSADQADLAAAGGLLSDVGLLVEVRHSRDRLDLAYQRAVADDVDLATTERETFDIDHAELGGHLLALWGLPEPLVAVVEQSRGRPDPAAELPLSPVDAVRAARLLAKRMPALQAIGRPHLDPVDAETASALDRWQAELGDLRGAEIDPGPKS